MCKSCGCKIAEKPVQYQCNCPGEDCTCGMIEFDKEPKAIPYCCGMPMKRVK